jgi:hypothetical protein
MKIITDPIEGILKPNARIRFYQIVTIVSSIGIAILSYMAKVLGRSVIFYF